MELSSDDEVFSLHLFGCPAPNGPSLPCSTLHCTRTYAFHPDSSLYSSDLYPPQGTSLFELFDNSSQKPDNDTSSFDSSACEYNPCFSFHPDSHPDSSFHLSDFYPPQGTALFGLFGNSSPKADDECITCLASDEHVWSSPNRSSFDSSACEYNPCFAFHPDSHPDSSFYLSDFYPPQGTALFELFGNSSPKADDEDITSLASDEHGGNSVNFSDAGIMTKPPADSGLNKPFGGGEQFSGGSQEWCLARDSCGSACYMCGEAEHFATRCSLGLDADCGRSEHDHHSGRDRTTLYII